MSIHLLLITASAFIIGVFVGRCPTDRTLIITVIGMAIGAIGAIAGFLIDCGPHSCP